MTQLFSDNASGKLNAGITASDTSIVLQAGQGAKFPSPTGGDHFKLTLTQPSTETSWEIVTIVGRTTDTLTVGVPGSASANVAGRGVDGTTAASWASGDKAEHRLTAADASSMNASIFSDSSFRIADNGDSTKKLAFEISGIATGQTRTLTAPDASGTIALTSDLGSSGLPVGTLIDFAGSTAPSGFLNCDGSAISRTTYAALYTAIGTLWGTGDGSTTFNLPNFAAGDAAVQHNGTVGASTDGTMPAHAHSTNFTVNYGTGTDGVFLQAAGGAAIDTGVTTTNKTIVVAGPTTSSGSGSVNKAGGKYVRKCIKY